MKSKPAIALYLGETYATVGLFELSSARDFNLLFEKTVFLPQVSLKNLLIQCKTRLEQHFTEYTAEFDVYVVTKYFDRLKQFRLGGSISQVIVKGFENSYTLSESKALSLAAAQLIISLDPENFTSDFLQTELERIKKINPDLNKVVISLPEDKFSTEQIDKITSFFTEAGLKIFRCSQPYNQSELRKTLLNAGSDGTKEEISGDISEAFGENAGISYFCQTGFESEFDNCELFNSANNFFAAFLKDKKLPACAYFDIESFRYIRADLNTHWLSPWGLIPIKHYGSNDLSIHPYAEVKLNTLTMLHIDNHTGQLEPGPVLAGRAIKPLVLDLFANELQQNDFCKNLFTQMAQVNLKAKISNLFSVLEKGQKNNSLGTSIERLKQIILETIVNEIKLISPARPITLVGPLADLFETDEDLRRIDTFSWPQEILKFALKDAHE